VSGDWLFAHFFQRMLIAGNVTADDVLTDMAMLSPNDALVPLLARSGEIAPFQMKSELLVAAPDWKREPAVGSISYQRSSVPAPPKTAWAVQRAVLPP